MAKQVAAVTAKVAVIAAVAVLIAGGAIGVYFYTSSPTIPSTRNTTTSDNASSGPNVGYIDASGTPQGAWADYLGYIPAGYTVAPHFGGANVYQCPAGMDPTQCAQFKASCGNGVCDPNESCSTCPIDCSVPGQLTCDPYTGRAGAPISICQLALNAPGG